MINEGVKILAIYPYVNERKKSVNNNGIVGSKENSEDEKVSE